MVSQDGATDHHAYHLAAWKQVHRQANGTEPIYLAARDANGKVAAGLPLWIRGGWLRGLVGGLGLGNGPASGSRRLVSLFSGGPLGTDLDARAAVLTAACRLADERGLQDLTITTRAQGCEELVAGLHVRTYHPGWVTPLPRDPDELRRQWQKHSKKLYRDLTRAEQSGAVVQPARSGADLWSFYRQYVQTMRRVRVVPRSWLEMRLAHKLLAPAGRCRVWLIEYRGEVVAGAMFLALGNVLEMFYLGSDRRAYDVRPAHAVYWHAIKWAIANGMTTVLWGNAPHGSSLASFKRKWNAEPVERFQYVYEPPSSASPWRHEVEPAAANGRRDESSGDGYRAHPSDSVLPTNPAGSLTAVWDRIPVDALGIAATIAHRFG